MTANRKPTEMKARREAANMRDAEDNFKLPAGVRSAFCKKHGGWENATDTQIQAGIDATPSPANQEAPDEPTNTNKRDRTSTD